VSECARRGRGGESHRDAEKSLRAFIRARCGMCFTSHVRGFNVRMALSCGRAAVNFLEGTGEGAARKFLPSMKKSLRLVCCGK
jgi:hypothetical protein